MEKGPAAGLQREERHLRGLLLVSWGMARGQHQEVSGVEVSKPGRELLLVGVAPLQVLGTHWVPR